MTELSHASLQRILLEERTALATPIDFADLEVTETEVTTEARI